MKAEIHPEYAEVTVTCVCGNSFQTRSTMGKDFHVEICSECHPFFTGKQKLVDTAGRVDRFRKKYGDNYAEEAKAKPQPKAASKKAEKPAKPQTEEPKAEEPKAAKPKAAAKKAEKPAPEPKVEAPKAEESKPAAPAAEESGKGGEDA